MNITLWILGFELNLDNSRIQQNKPSRVSTNSNYTDFSSAVQVRKRKKTRQLRIPKLDPKIATKKHPLSAIDNRSTHTQKGRNGYPKQQYEGREYRTQRNYHKPQNEYDYPITNSQPSQFSKIKIDSYSVANLKQSNNAKPKVQNLNMYNRSVQNNSLTNPFLDDNSREIKHLNSSLKTSRVHLVDNGYQKTYQRKGPEYFKKLELQSISQNLNNSKSSFLNQSAGQSQTKGKFLGVWKYLESGFRGYYW